jgi:hypothetical protein
VACNNDGNRDKDELKRYDSIRITDLETLCIVKEEAPGGFVRFEVERELDTRASTILWCN